MAIACVGQACSVTNFLIELKAAGTSRELENKDLLQLAMAGQHTKHTIHRPHIDPIPSIHAACITLIPHQDARTHLMAQPRTAYSLTTWRTPSELATPTLQSMRHHAHDPETAFHPVGLLVRDTAPA